MALVAVAALLVVGLERPDAGDAVIVAPKTATRSADAGDRARRTAARRSEALRANLPEGRLSPGPASGISGSQQTPRSTPARRSSCKRSSRRSSVSGQPTSAPGSEATTPHPFTVSALRSREYESRLEGRNFLGGQALQRAFASVPIPPDAKPAAGPDRHMTIWQPSSDTLWEFFKARRRSDGWHARWGGAIRRVSKSPGYYSQAAWPGATDNWGATASSLPVIGGTMLLDELKAGRIDHALAINLPAPRANVFAWPAQRTDGTGPLTALPEGARLRLDPDVDVSALGLPKLTQMIARAAQRHGLVVRDQTGHAISLFLGNQSQLPVKAYGAYFQGQDAAGLARKLPVGPSPGVEDAPLYEGAVPPWLMRPPGRFHRSRVQLWAIVDAGLRLGASATAGRSRDPARFLCASSSHRSGIRGLIVLSTGFSVANRHRRSRGSRTWSS